MSDRTPEQDAADAAFDAAVMQLANAYDLLADGFFVARWVLCGAAHSPERPGDTCYWHHFPGGSQATDVSVGLMEVTKNRLLATGWEDDG